MAFVLQTADAPITGEFLDRKIMLLPGGGEEGIWKCSVIQTTKNQRRPEVCRDKHSPFWRGERKRVTFEKQEYAFVIQAPELFQLPLSLYCFWRSVCYTGFGFCLLENNRLT